MINTSIEDNAEEAEERAGACAYIEDFTVGEMLMAVLFIIMLNNHIYVPCGLLFVSHLNQKG